MEEEIAKIRLIYATVFLIIAVVFGVISKKINESKGYYGGFWWGFFLGWIGVLVVALKQDNRSSYNYNGGSERNSYDSAMSNFAAEKSARQQLQMNEGSWRCRACGRVNANYVTSCLCGVSQKSNDQPEEETWKCRVCGRENTRLHKTCVCGATKAGRLPEGGARIPAPAGAQDAQPKAQLSAADEIAKFKSLLDSGAITQEEYDAKKKQLLGL